jgi:hypothetical protein
MGRLINTTVTQLWGPITLKIEAITSPKRRVYLEPHGVIPQKTFVKACLRLTVWKCFTEMTSSLDITRLLHVTGDSIKLSKQIISSRNSKRG